MGWTLAETGGERLRSSRNERDDDARPGRDRYRRGQRRRARIAWAVLGLLVVGIGLAIAFGGNDGESSDATSVPGLLPAEMSASAYTAIHKGRRKSKSWA